MIRIITSPDGRSRPLMLLPDELTWVTEEVVMEIVTATDMAVMRGPKDLLDQIRVVP
jgi:hypothetical protein